MGQLYTVGRWAVKPGREEEFIAAWRELAEWTGREVRGSSRARLLCDSKDPRRFVSFGPWEDLEAIEEWRALPGFQEGVAWIREMLESFEPSTLEVVAETG